MSSKIEAVIAAPVVSSDSTSPEAIMARDAKKIAAQAQANTQFDTVVEPFYRGSQSISTPLVASLVALGLLALACFVGGPAKRR